MNELLIQQWEVIHIQKQENKNLQNVGKNANKVGMI